MAFRDHRFSKRDDHADASSRLYCDFENPANVHENQPHWLVFKTAVPVLGRAGSPTRLASPAPAVVSHQLETAFLRRGPQYAHSRVAAGQQRRAATSAWAPRRPQGAIVATTSRSPPPESREVTPRLLVVDGRRAHPRQRSVRCRLLHSKIADERAARKAALRDFSRASPAPNAAAPRRPASWRSET